jgi:hypothetical protein
MNKDINLKPNLRQLTDSELIFNCNSWVKKESEALTMVLQHLQEIDLRGLHFKSGCGSLTEYAQVTFGYTESEAHKRVSAMRLLKDIPQIEEKLQSGSLTLTSLSIASTYFNHSKKTLERPLSLEQKTEIIETMENKSTRECLSELRSLNPTFSSAPPIDRFVTPELKSKFDLVKNLMSHKNPNPSTLELLELMADFCIKALDPGLKKTQRAVSAARQSPNRYVPSALKTQIWNRDQGACTFKDHATSRVCGSKHLLQLDHIKPYALGGETSENNLRLLCASHNKWRATETFGQRNFS